MKVALLGAAGSGKSSVAKAISRRMNMFAGDRAEDHWDVVDGYVERLAKRTGLTYGIAADWPMNVQIMGHRWEAEAHAVKDGYNAICCGTIYETAVYATTYSLVSIKQPVDEAGMLAQSAYLNAMMDFTSAMETTTVDYDLMFYLPLEEKVRTWPGVIDAKIEDVLDAYYKRAYTLTGSTRERADAATEAIREVQRVTTPEASDSQ